MDDLYKRAYLKFMISEYNEEEVPLYMKYHENSKLDREIHQPIFRNIVEFMSNPLVAKFTSNPQKFYSNFKKKFKLNKTELKKPLGEILLKRRSPRGFIQYEVEYLTISNLFEYSCGISKIFKVPISIGNEKEDIHKKFRTYPSGGALYPVEVYCLITNIQDIPDGLYYYSSDESCLILLKENVNDWKLQFCKDLPTKNLENCNIIVFLTACFLRSTAKYNERGYRFVLIEAGHIAQNFCLVATSLDLSVLPIGGGYDREIEEFLNIDGVEESLLYVLFIGKEKENFIE